MDLKTLKLESEMNGVDLVGPTVGDQKRYEVEKKPKRDDPPPYPT